MGVTYVKGRAHNPWRALYKGNHLGMFSTMEEVEKAVTAEQERREREPMAKQKEEPIVDSIPYVFEGVDVKGSDVKIRRTGDGLSEAMHFEPTVVHKGERRFVLLEVECADIAHPWADKKDHAEGAVRMHLLDAFAGMWLDADLAFDAIEQHKLRMATYREAERERKAEERGEFKLNFDGDEAPADPDPLADMFPDE